MAQTPPPDSAQPQCRLTAQQAAWRAGVPVHFVYAWCNKRLLSHYRLPGVRQAMGRILIDARDLEAFLQAQRREALPPPPSLVSTTGLNQTAPPGGTDDAGHSLIDAHDVARRVKALRQRPEWRAPSPRLTVQEASKYSGVAEAALGTWCRAYGLPHSRVPVKNHRWGKILIEQADLDVFLLILGGVSPSRVIEKRVERVTSRLDRSRFR